MSPVFLTANWRKLLIANYIVDPNVLAGYIPAHTSLDLWNGRCYISLVGFMFQNTKVLGLQFPFHTNFEEVNLRIYVSHTAHEQTHRGVVFIKEIVPRRMIAVIANTRYREHYQTMPMEHRWEETEQELQITYRWKKKTWNELSARAINSTQEIETGSEEEFITEHYRGYSIRGKQQTIAYAVEHPRWKIYPVISYQVNADFGSLYGDCFSFLNKQEPASVFLAEGSAVVVRKGIKLK
jgi:uncharacterized protein YqjF (DUF2071 family)